MLLGVTAAASTRQTHGQVTDIDATFPPQQGFILPVAAGMTL
jgi:hypothetical protein